MLVAPGLEIGKAELDAAGLRRGRARPCVRDSVARKRRSWLMMHQRRALRRRARAPAIRWSAGRDGWSARRAAGCRAPAPARARARRGALRRPRGAPGSSLAVEAELFQQIARLVRVVGGPEPGLDIGERRRVAGEIRLLRQIAHGGARLHEAPCRGRARSARRRSSAASICRSRCGRPGTRARPPTPTARRRRAAACRRRSARCL